MTPARPVGSPGQAGASIPAPSARRLRAPRCLPPRLRSPRPPIQPPSLLAAAVTARSARAGPPVSCSAAGRRADRKPAARTDGGESGFGGGTAQAVAVTPSPPVRGGAGVGARPGGRVGAPLRSLGTTRAPSGRRAGAARAGSGDGRTTLRVGGAGRTGDRNRRRPRQDVPRPSARAPAPGHLSPGGGIRSAAGPGARQVSGSVSGARPGGRVRGRFGVRRRARRRACAWSHRPHRRRGRGPHLSARRCRRRTAAPGRNGRAGRARRVRGRRSGFPVRGHSGRHARGTL